MSLLGEISMLAIYGHFAQLRNTPGKIIVMICVVLLSNDILSMCMVFATLSSKICKSLGVVVHWFALALSSWTNVFAYDLWKTLRRSFERRRDTRYGLFWYNMFAWCVPTLIVVALTICDFFAVFAAGYDIVLEDLCWMRSTKARLVFYLIPTYVMVAVNVIFLVSIVCKLHGNFNTSITPENVSFCSITYFYNLFYVRREI